MIVYFAGETEPEPVECEQFGYPHHDVTGRQQYENTHFQTEEEAWRSVLSGSEYAQHFAAQRVKEAERVLAEAKEELIRSALRLSEAKAKFRGWPS